MNGAELERAAAAVLQASGWYVRRSLREEQVFELDVLGYRFPGGEEESVVVESKSGKKSGFGVLWKLLGLKTHLALDQGVLLADPADPNHGRKVQLGDEHDIAVVDQAADSLGESFADADVIEITPAAEAVENWVRCYRVEDALIRVLYDSALWEAYDTIKLAKKQLQELVSRAWLEPDPWRQAVKLYLLYSDEPKISKRMSQEMNGDGAYELFQRALREGKSAEMQACFYVEHRKRIELAFAATRCAALGDESSRWARMAPHSFRDMVERIENEEAWYLPTVMQVYFLGFGGMICLDVEDAEYKHIARQAGCTPKQARHALKLFGDLFPYEGGWYYDGYELSRLKLCPVPLRGAGFWMREWIYDGEWIELATANQRVVAGVNECNLALAFEKTVLPGSRAKVR